MIISDYICRYQFISSEYPPISVCIRPISAPIYLYLGISVYIQKLQFDGKNIIFREFFILNPFSKQAGLSAPQKSKIPMSAPRSDTRTFQCHNTAVHIQQWWWFTIWSGTYFSNMFISVYISVYPGICVCMCALTVYIPNQGVCDPYGSLYGSEAHPCGQRRRLPALVNWYLQYEQIWARYVYVRMCSNLWR